MKLIKKLGTRKNKTGNNTSSRGLFICPYCNKEVNKMLSHGRVALSCGCMLAEWVRVRFIKHGDRSKKSVFYVLYSTWCEMKSRCYNRKRHNYKWYGGRGIIICGEWKNDYITFKKWALENGWEKRLELDRRNNDGNYEPSNCRFITHAENIRNGSATKLDWNKVREIRKKYATGIYTQKDLAREYKVVPVTIGYVINGKIWKE